MENALRYSGIDIAGDMQWGTHFCQFYHTKEDLIDILVPYFKVGLENNEFCIWITSEPLSVDESHEALQKALTNYEHFIKKGQIEIIPYSRWYIRDGVFDPEGTLTHWVEKLDEALNRGYDGLRISGNTSWLEEKNWNNFVNYEEEIKKFISNYKIIALCSYSLNKCNSNEVIDVVNNHQFLLIKHHGGWTLLENRKKRIEEALKKSEEKFRLLIQHAPTGICEIDFRVPKFLSVNDTLCSILGYTREELLSMNPLDLFEDESKTVLKYRLKKYCDGEELSDSIEYKVKKKDGTLIHGLLNISLTFEDGIPVDALVVAHDITELKKTEENMERLLEKEHQLTEELQKANKELQQQKNELERIAQRDEAILSSMSEGLIITDNNDQISFINHTAKQILGFENLDDVNQTMKEFGPVIKTVYLDGTEIPLGKCPSSRAKHERFSNLEVKVKRIDKPIEFIGSCNGAPIINNGEIMGSVLTFRDITKLKNTQKELKSLLKKADEHRDHLQTIIDNLPVGLWITDENGKMVLVNDHANEIWRGKVHLADGLDEYGIYKSWWANTEERIPVEKMPLVQALKGKSSKEVVIDIERLDGTYGTQLVSAVPIKDSNSKIIGSIAIVQDITELKNSEKYMQELLEKEHHLREKLQISNLELNRTKNILEKTVHKLEISNADLEQFAYVASHDLQEPLRMVSSFTQLLEKQYKNRLDEDADDYIDFIVEGAHRMKDLIYDLLTFSRLNTEAKEFEETKLETILNDVLTTLKSSIEENDVKITHNNLPTVMADPTQIQQLFQNLLTNAIKFCGERNPEIHLDAAELEDEWKISISDNGIGISPLNQEKIFNVFTRLHTREEYEGTGIGLSICKRIVQRHGGRIWVESEERKGSTFYFTISKLE